MKINIFISITFLFLSLRTVTAQNKVPIAESITEAKLQGVTIEHLDSLYKDGFNVDTTKAVFTGHMTEFNKAYTKMLGDFAQQLQKNKSFENKSFHFWNRVYFQPDGTIDYYLYSLKPGVLTQEEEALFKKTLNEFIKNYKFTMTAKMPFAQCSPVNISASEK